MAAHNGRIASGTGAGISNLPKDGHVEQVIRQAHAELRILLQQRSEVMKRIGTLKQIGRAHV